MNIQEIKQAFNAIATAEMRDHAAKGYARWGAARLYVIVTDKTAAKAVHKAGYELRQAYGLTTRKCAYYVGYQNFDVETPAKALAIAAALNNAGVQCYVDAYGD